jgi:hypothetical protein
MQFCIHQILLFYQDISLSKVSYAKKKDMAMLKKDKIHAKEHERKNWTNVQRIKQWVLRCPPKKEERKEKK